MCFQYIFCNRENDVFGAISQNNKIKYGSGIKAEIVRMLMMAPRHLGANLMDSDKRDAKITYSVGS